MTLQGNEVWVLPEAHAFTLSGSCFLPVGLSLSLNPCPSIHTNIYLLDPTQLLKIT